MCNGTCANPSVCCGTGQTPSDLPPAVISSQAIAAAFLANIEPPPVGSDEVVEEPPSKNDAAPAVGSGEEVVEPPPEIATAPAVGSGALVAVPSPEILDAPAVGSSEEDAEPPLGQVLSGDETTEPFETATVTNTLPEVDSD